MPTERRRTAALVALILLPASLLAQDPLVRTGPLTEVDGIAFRFEDTKSLSEDDLVAQIATTARGTFAGLRGALAWLPFMPPVGKHPFDPLELQRDVIRLRRFYAKEGFPRAVVRYEVNYDGKSDRVEITFVITEGPPVRIATVQFQDSATGGPIALPEELQPEWEDVSRKELEHRGIWSERERLAFEDRSARFFRNRGYPFAIAAASAVVDSAASRADVTVRVATGSRMRIGSFEVTGTASVPPEHVTRQLPLEPGDWYSAAALEQGRQRVSQLDLLRMAVLEKPRSSPQDSTVTVEIRVVENKGHLITGDAGFSSEGGLTVQGDWTERNFMGGIRTLTIGVVAQTGLLALENPPQILYRLGATVFQPYLMDYRLSLSAGPYIEYRDDVRDRSWAIGLDGALVFATGPLRSVSLGYSISRRDILDFRVAETPAGAADVPEALGFGSSAGLDSLADVVERSALSLGGTYGWLDNLTHPRRGYVLRPRVEVTVPNALNSAEYVRLELQGTGYLPLTPRIGLVVRGLAGRLLPYGESIPPEGTSPFVALQRLRDVVFSAGGTRDVRGYGNQLLGPKVPEVVYDDDGNGTVERYTPVGGTAKAMGSVELRLPFPKFPETWQTLVFLDAGRVWSPDDEFAPVDDFLEQEKFFFTTGAGIAFETIAGAIQLAVGYKLNPSPLDLRDANEVFQAIEDGRDVESVPTSNSRRFHLHFAIGATF
jgi:outer membrane protein insertion porin family